MKILARLSELTPTRKLLLVFLALLVICGLLLLVLLLRTATSKPVAASLALPAGRTGVVIQEEGAALMRLLKFPEIPYSRLSFPLDTSRNTRYSKEELERMRPELPETLVRALERRRKEQLETIFSAVD